MKILILGVTGLLGCQVYDVFLHHGFNVTGTARSLPSDFFLPTQNIKTGLDILWNKNDLHKLFSENFDFVINCIGIVPRMCSCKSAAAYINAVFPHELSFLCKKYESNLIHISTDCVFRGEKGNYFETDIPDASDFYGKTKSVGEPDDCMVVRTSIIGHEFRNKTGLLEWVFSQKNKIRGFKNVIWNGVTARELSKILSYLILSSNVRNGVIHLGGEPMSKLDLIKKINDIYRLNKHIEVEENVTCNKTLNCSKFNSISTYKINTIDKMIEEMKHGWKL